MAVEVQSVFLIDGYGYESIDHDQLLSIPFDFGGAVSNHFRYAMRFDEIGHWKNLTFDPHLGSLFQGDQIGDTGPTGSNTKLAGKFAAWKAAVIAISIVAVAIIVVVAAWTYRKKMKETNPFRPTKQAKEALSNDDGRTAPSPASSKPTDNSSQSPSTKEVSANTQPPTGQWSRGIASR